MQLVGTETFSKLDTNKISSGLLRGGCFHSCISLLAFLLIWLRGAFVAARGVFIAACGVFIAARGVFVAARGAFVAASEIFIAACGIFYVAPCMWDLVP